MPRTGKVVTAVGLCLAMGAFVLGCAPPPPSSDPPTTTTRGATPLPPMTPSSTTSSTTTTTTTPADFCTNATSTLYTPAGPGTYLPRWRVEADSSFSNKQPSTFQITVMGTVNGVPAQNYFDQYADPTDASGHFVSEIAEGKIRGALGSSGAIVVTRVVFNLGFSPPTTSCNVPDWIGTYP